MSQYDCEFACAILIDTAGRLLFQQRDDIPGITYPGMLGLFGGHREPDETFQECVSREVHEEISYLIPPGSFELLSDYANDEPDIGRVRGEFYLARGVPVDGLRITEGSLCVAMPHELPFLMERIAPPARMAVRLFIHRELAERQTA